VHDEPEAGCRPQLHPGRSAIRAFVEASETTGPVLLSIELRHLGGAVRRGNPDGGAVAGFTADVALFAVGMTPTPETAAAVRAAITAVRDRMAPWSAGRCYLNFAEEAKTGDTLFGAPTHARLRQIKAAYDPTDLIRSNHPITPAQP
jgi:hypothetical protein